MAEKAAAKAPYRPHCPECGSAKVWLVGQNLTRQGKAQRYKCTKCARTFTQKRKRGK